MTGLAAIEAFLKDRITLLVNEPLHHSPSGEALEETLINLEHVLQFLSHDGNFELTRNARYFDFLMSRGFGVGTVAGRIVGNESRAEQMESVVSVWKDYLRKYYLTEGEK